MIRPLSSALLVGALVAGCSADRAPRSIPAVNSASLPPPLVAPPPAPPVVAAPVVTSLPTVAPTAALPPPLLRLDATGCFAWSASEHAAACIEDEGSIQGGCREDLVIFGATPTVRHRTLDVPRQCLGEHPPHLADAARAAVEPRLRASFEPLPAPTATLGPGEKVDVGKGTVEFRHTVTGHASRVDGAWEIYTDEVRLRCGGERRPVFHEVIENAVAPTVTVTEVGGGWLVIAYSVTWGIEGDAGGRTDVALVDESRCAVLRP